MFAKDTVMETRSAVNPLDKKVVRVEDIPETYTLRRDPESLLRELTIDSPYVLKYHRIDYSFKHQQAQSVVEEINGTTLKRFLTFGCPSYPVLKQMIFKILKGFEEIHQSGVLHRNIKLNSIQVEFSFPVFSPKIGKFQLMEPFNKKVPVLKRTDYVAPEVTYYCDYDSQSEVWAIGVLIYKILCFKFSSEDKSDQCPLLSMYLFPAYYHNFLEAALSPDTTSRPKNISALNKILYNDLCERDQIGYDILG